MSKFPLAELVDHLVDWLQTNFGSSMDAFSYTLTWGIEGLGDILVALPWWLIILAFGGISWWAKGPKLMLGTVLGLFFIFNLGLWPAFISTLILVVI